MREGAFSRDGRRGPWEKTAFVIGPGGMGAMHAAVGGRPFQAAVTASQR